MKLRPVAVLALTLFALSACATRSGTEHAACVAPCAQDMNRMQFLEDTRSSGFEATRMNIIGADEAIVATRAREAGARTTAKAQ